MTTTQEERWTSNTLTRTTGQAYRTLLKARQRHIDYPTPPRATPAIQEPGMHATVDEAFSSMMASLSTASRNCLRYYRSSPATEQTKHDRRFCARYLTPSATARRRYLNEDNEDLQILVGPGTYSVTAAACGKGRIQQQTHVIKVGHGETATVDFTL